MELFSKDNYVFILLLFATIYAITAILLMRKTRKKREIIREDISEKFIAGIRNETIKDSDNLMNFYKGMTNLSSDDLEYRQGLNKWLRLVFANVSGGSNCYGIISNNTERETITKKISEFILINEKEAPFADLPERERNILKDIDVYLKNSDTESVERKIKELSTIIQTRYEEQKKLESQNKLAVQIAIIGIVLTITFGILQLFNS